MSVNDLIPLLQIAISPVILISAVGLLLLTMNNRLAHAIDRARSLLKACESATETQRTRLKAQVVVLWRRIRLLRHAIELASLSALCAALLIIALFVTALLGGQNAWIISLPFIASLTALSAALVCLILDVHQSLCAFQLELDGQQKAHK